MDVWELNPESLESLWQNISVTCGEEEFFVKVAVFEGRWAVPISSNILAFALQVRKAQSW
jgi:hypothetical protein